MITARFANGRVHPLPTVAEDNFLPDILRERSLNRLPKSATELAIAIADIENPTRNTPDTVDCVSCHAAQPAGTLLVPDALRIAEQAGGEGACFPVYAATAQ